MKTKLFYSVVQDYSGKWSVCSFLGKNKTEEKRFALSMNRACILVTENYDAAQQKAAELRKETVRG